MKRMIKILMVVVVIGILSFGCATQRQTTRTLEGAAIGAVPGLLMKNAYVAVAGSLLLGAVGNIVGLIEDEHGGSITGSKTVTPFPWIRGERTAVFVEDYYWGEPLRAMVEDYLRGQGAVIVATPGRRYNIRPEDLASAVYIAEVYTQRLGDYVASRNLQRLLLWGGGRL
jgi:hypothetical protein